jgi:hypothetical protein
MGIAEVWSFQHRGQMPTLSGSLNPLSQSAGSLGLPAQESFNCLELYNNLGLAGQAEDRREGFLRIGMLLAMVSTAWSRQLRQQTAGPFRPARERGKQ